VEGFGIRAVNGQIAERLFGRDGRQLLPPAIEAFARAEVGSEVERWLFVSERRSLTCGLALVDGSEVVIKAHPPGTDAGRLQAAQGVQCHLVEQGFGCPRPLLAPRPLGTGLAVVESHLERGRSPDPSDAADRTSMARTLGEISRICKVLRPQPALDVARLPRLPRRTQWPPPPDSRLELCGGGAEGDWIDGLGSRARRVRTRATPAPRAIGHGDWHVEHLRLEGGVAVATYDWDSVLEAPEPFIVGCAVGGFTADWSVDEPPIVPTHAIARRFVADYEAARGRRFTTAEHTTIEAHWLEMTAYAARVELAREGAGLESITAYRDELTRHAAEMAEL
jgi:hypothetical protein